MIYTSTRIMLKPTFSFLREIQEGNKIKMCFTSVNIVSRYDNEEETEERRIYRQPEME